MKGHFYTTNPSIATGHIRNDGLVLEGVACYVYKYDPNQPLPPGTARFFQLYDRVTDFRFYTANEDEVVQLFGTGNFTEEDVSSVSVVYWPNQPSGTGTTELYRLRNLTTNEHLYTTSQGEKSALDGHGWKYEGPACYVFNPGQAPEGTIPLYRLFKP